MGKLQVIALLKLTANNSILNKSVQFSHSVVSHSVTPWTVAHQASLSITNPELAQTHVH